MSNTNRDYAIVYDVKNSSLVLNRPLIFYITDKNTSNIFVRLVTAVSVGNGIDQYTDLEPATNYVLTMRVIKPSNEVKNIKATQHEAESIFQFDLTEDFKDIPGKYICELTVSTIVNGRQELITSDPFNYEVKRSILSNVGEIIETEDTTVEKLLNDLDATKAELSSQIKSMVGSPLVANTISEMVDSTKVYVYIGNEEGYINGNWYYNDSGVWQSGGVYNATAIGEKTITPNKTTFVKDINLAKSEYLLMNATITVTSENVGTYSASSSKNKVAIFEVDTNSTYIITKLPTKFFEVMGTSGVPIFGTTSATVKKYMNDDKSKIMIDTGLCDHICIWLYNQDNDTYSLDEILNSLIVCKEDDYKYNDKIIMEDIIINRKNLSDDLQDHLFEEKGKIINKYYATVRANSSADYRREIVTIKVNFEKGECKSEDHLRVFRDGSEYDFEYIPCTNDNVLNGENYGYWNDNSLRSGEIIFSDSLLSGGKNTYEVRVYDQKQPGDIHAMRIKTEIDNNSGNVIFNCLGNTVVFAQNRKYGLRYLNSIEFENRDYVNINGSVTELLASGTSADYSYSITGKGYVYKCLTRRIKYLDTVELVSDTYFYANAEIVQKSYFRTLKNTDEGYIQSMITELRVPVTSYSDIVTSTYHTDFTLGDKTAYLCCLYANGEVKRMDSSSEVNLPSFAGATSSDGGSKTAFQFGFKYNSATRYAIPKDKVISSCWALKLDADSSYYLRKFNPLIGIASNKNKYKNKQILENTLYSHIEYISECWDRLKSTNSSSYNLTNISIHQEFWLYKHKNKYSWSRVVNDFKTVVSNVFGDNSLASFENVYQNGIGLEYTGRWISCAWLLYKEALILNDTSNIEYFKTTLLNYATFIKNIYDKKGDVPLQSGGTGNGNSRCMALRALCVGEYLSPNTYRTTINGLLQVISGYIRGENYIPDQPNIVTYRALHYWAFAHYQYERARKLVNFSNILKNSSQICLDAVNSNGEPKELTWCNINSRRGAEQTYAYIIGMLLCNDNYQDTELANRVADYLCLGDLPLGTQQYPLGGYLESTEVTYKLQLVISLNDIVDVFEEFFE